MIEKYFTEYGGPDIIFNPIPSYSDDWGIDLKNLVKNAKKENGINLFEQYYESEVNKKLSKFFKSPQIYNIKLPLVSKPNSNHQGRKLCLFRNGFYLYIGSFLSNNIDTLGKDKKKVKEEFVNFLLKTKDTQAVNEYFRNLVKTKIERIESVESFKNGSKFYEYAAIDYIPYNHKMSFNTFLRKTKEMAEDIHNGLQQLGDFFNEPLDYNKLYKCFNPDTFYLLIAKIICEDNLEIEGRTHNLCNNYGYLIEYCIACEQEIIENKKYNPVIEYAGKDGKNKRYTRRDVMGQIKELIERHPEAKPIFLPKLKEEKDYLNIDLINKLTELYQGKTSVNWELLPKGEGIKR